MKKRVTKMAVSVLAALSLVLSLCGCAGGAAKTVAIEVSDTKVEVEVDDKATVEIENYDELQDVEIEVSDEEIIKVKDKNGTLTITGLEEGKAKITITASNAEEDITIKVTVTGGDDPEPEPEPEPEPVPEPVPDPEPVVVVPDPEPEPVSSRHTVSDWYGNYHGTVYLYGNGSWAGDDPVWDCTATVATTDGGDYFEVYSDDMDLWGMEWDSSYPVITFWVDLTDTRMTADTVNDAWVLDANDLGGVEMYWDCYDVDDWFYVTYDYYDSDYQGGYYVYIELQKD